MDTKKLSTEEELDLLKKAILNSVARYDGVESLSTMNFQNGLWDANSVAADIETVKKIRKQSGLLQSKKIETSPEELALFVATARMIVGRYTWPDQFSMNITRELSGNPTELNAWLQKDYFDLCDLRHNAKKDKSLLKNCSFNLRVMTTVEGLLFHAIRSIVPFTGKKSNGIGHIRYMRCLEGLLFQIAKTLDPNFSTKKN